MEREEIVSVSISEKLYPKETPIRIDFGYRVHYLSKKLAQELKDQLDALVLNSETEDKK